MKGTRNQTSFSKGELSPDLMGRIDIAQYQSGLKKARNVIFNKRGILYNAPGTETILPGKYPTKTTRLIPFKFSFNQQYMLVFGDMYIHVIVDGVPVFNFPTAPNVTSFPNGTNPTITIAGGSTTGPAVTPNQIANGMLVQLQPTQPNTPLASNDFSIYGYNRWFIVQNVTIGTTTTTFTLTDLYGNNIDSTTWGNYSGNLNLQTVYEIPTTYAYADLPLLKWAQSFDIMQLRHPSYQRMQLSRLGTNTWVLNVNPLGAAQQQFGNSFSAGGGSASGTNYYYKFSTYDLSTKFESLPCPIATFTPSSQLLLSAEVVGPPPLIPRFSVSNSAGFAAGQTIYFSQNITLNFFGPYLMFTALVPYTVKEIGVGYIDVYPPSGFLVYEGTISFPSGTNIFNTGVSSANQIASLSNTNPIHVVTVGAHGLVDGQETTMQGTGVYGLDGLTFNVTIVNTTTLSLNGVNGNDYNLAGFVASASTIISATTSILVNANPTQTDGVQISGAILDNQVLSSDIVFLIYASLQLNSGFGFIGYAVPDVASGQFTFIDPGIPPDPTLSPKGYTPLFVGAGNYPSGCNYYQQRLVEFSTLNEPQGLWASVIGDYNDFSTHDPIQENDAILLDVWSNELSQIFDSADDGFLVLMTDMGPMVVAGDTTGEFTPSSNLIKRQMFAGAAQQPRPLTIFKNIVYLEASQASMRDLQILVTPYYTYISQSDDISVFSEHLLTQSPVIGWDYKLYPDSQIFSVRADGKMIATTYLKEQEIQAFSWMDTIGSYLDVSCAQEGTETAVYTTVQRASGPWIERFASRYYKDQSVDAVFTHATDSYNGLLSNSTNTTLNANVTAVLSGTTTLFESVLTATFSNNSGQYFTVGWIVIFKYFTGTKDRQGNPIIYFARLKITGTTNNTITGTLLEAVNSGILGPTIMDIRISSNVLAGLWHLNGQQVSVVADGWVQSNPNDNTDTALTVTNGAITLPQNFGVINAGLPYLSDMQTLDIDEHQGETFMDKKIAVKRVTLKLLNTGNLLVGPDFSENLPSTMFMDSTKFREMQGYDQTSGLFTGITEVPIDARYGFGGSFALRNVQPLPMTLLSIAPLVEVQTG